MRITKLRFDGRVNLRAGFWSLNKSELYDLSVLRDPSLVSKGIPTKENDFIVYEQYSQESSNPINLKSTMERKDLAWRMGSFLSCKKAGDFINFYSCLRGTSLNCMTRALASLRGYKKSLVSKKGVNAFQKAVNANACQKMEMHFTLLKI